MYFAVEFCVLLINYGDAMFYYKYRLIGLYGGAVIGVLVVSLSMFFSERDHQFIEYIVVSFFWAIVCAVIGWMIVWVVSLPRSKASRKTGDYYKHNSLDDYTDHTSSGNNYGSFNDYGGGDGGGD